jgi:phosphatidylserine/phosphatidylglycerophosphate/cardiolipin synthase-like enzyme
MGAVAPWAAMLTAWRHSRYGVSACASGVGVGLLILSSYAWAQSVPPMSPERQVSVFFAPFHDLARMDVEVMSQARRSIDLAAGRLPSEAVLQALLAAAQRSVRLRLYLAEADLRENSLPPKHPLARLSVLPQVEIRLSPAHAGALHWRAFILDGRLVRSGGADFAHLSFKRADGDLLLITSPDIIRAYEGTFAIMWERGANRPFKVR